VGQAQLVSSAENGHSSGVELLAESECQALGFLPIGAGGKGLVVEKHDPETSGGGGCGHGRCLKDFFGFSLGLNPVLAASHVEK